MAESTRPVIIDPLKGTDQRWGARAPQANRVRDLYWDPRGGWSSAGGYRRIIVGPTEANSNPPVITNPFRSSGAIESIHWFSQHNGARRWLIYVDGSGKLYMFNPSDAARIGSPGDQARDRAGNLIVRSVVPTPWQRHQSVCWGENLYLVNGIDRPLVFNGYWWDFAGWPTPAPAPTASAMNSPRPSDSGSPTAKMENTGVGPTAEMGGEDYLVGVRYRMSYVNDRGQESPLSEPSEMVVFTNAAGKASHFVKLGLALGPSSTVARRLYRTQNIYDSTSTQVTGRADQFFFHSEIPDNVTDLLQDALPDGSLGALVDDTALGVFPTEAKFLAPFKGRMFAVTGATSEVLFSAPGQPEVFPPDNRIPIPDGHLGPVTAIWATRNALIVFKAKGVYLIKGDGETYPFQAEPLTRAAGCVAPNTIRDVPNTGVVFLGESGLWVLNGTLENEGVPTGITPMMVPLPDTVRRLNRSALINACAAAYHRDRELWLAVPTVGSAKNNLLLVWHWDIREWSERPDFPIASMLETPDTAGLLLFGSHDTDHPGIHVYSRRFVDKDGVAIAPLYESGQISVGGAYRTFRPKTLLVTGILHGNNDLTMNARANRSQTYWYSVSSYGVNPLPSIDQQYPQEIVPVFGTAKFDDGLTTWQQWRPGAMRFDLDNPSFVLEFQVSLAPQASKRWMTLLGMNLEIAVDDATPIKPLRPDAGPA